MTGSGPGALASAMLSAAVAARADPVRFGRGRTYVREGAVVDLSTAPGMLSASVVGSRPAPYRVSVAVPGTAVAAAPAGPSDPIDVRRLNELVPRPEEMRCACTCPDGPADPCKHAVAALLAFADQVAIHPELLAEWRSGPAAADGVLARIGRTVRAGARAPHLLGPRHELVQPAHVDRGAGVGRSGRRSRPGHRDGHPVGRRPRADDRGGEHARRGGQVDDGSLAYVGPTAPEADRVGTGGDRRREHRRGESAGSAIAHWCTIP